MNIQQAKEEIIHTLQAYLQKGEDGEYAFPAVHQRPILLIGPPGVVAENPRRDQSGCQQR